MIDIPKVNNDEKITRMSSWWSSFLLSENPLSDSPAILLRLCCMKLPQKMPVLALFDISGRGRFSLSWLRLVGSNSLFCLGAAGGKLFGLSFEGRRCFGVLFLLLGLSLGGLLMLFLWLWGVVWSWFVDRLGGTGGWRGNLRLGWSSSIPIINVVKHSALI